MRTTTKTMKRWARTLMLDPLSDRHHIAAMYWRAFHRPVNLDAPETFNEKMQWLKLFGNTERYANLADKFTVREYVSAKIGGEYLNELIGVYNTPSEIEYGQLPEGFVLKATHGSHMNIICRDKRSLDVDACNRQLRQWLAVDYYRLSREPVYKNIRPRIVCERLLEDKGRGGLLDYKVLCFNGRVQVIEVHMDRFSNHTHNSYDRDWRKLPFSWAEPTSPVVNDRPDELAKMIQIAETLAEGILFVRVDMYNVNHRIFFGELTFFPDSGFEKFEPSEWDQRLGAYLHLPEKVRNRN